jgi:hypothetical protein
MEAVCSAIKPNISWNNVICREIIEGVNIGCLMDIATFTKMLDEI